MTHNPHNIRKGIFYSAFLAVAVKKPVSKVNYVRIENPNSLKMAVPNNKSDDALLKNLVPLNTLSEDQLGQLLSRIVIEKARKGKYLFREGDSDHQNIYLLSGTVALLSGEKEMDLVSSGTQTARFALAHQLPRKHSARAKSAVTYVRIDSRMLSDMLARSHTASYEVNEADSAGKNDWMSLLLHSPVFQQIPPANLQRVMMRMRQVTVSADEDIIRQGDDGDYFYLISRGGCRVTRQPAADRPPVELAQLKAGQGFGEESLISNKPRSSTVTMITDGELVRLSKQDFVELVKQPLSSTIDYPDACRMVEQDALWIDVRAPEEYDAGHLPDAINLPSFSLRFQAPSLASDRIYLIYGAEVGEAATAAYLLVERGYEVFVLNEGWSEIATQAGVESPVLESQTDNVIDFNRDTDTSPESEAQQPALVNEKDANAVRDLHKQLANARGKFEKKLSQYQTEQKLLKQALSVAKRKLEVHEKNSEKNHESLSQEVGQLQAALAEGEKVQQKNDEAHIESERLHKKQTVDLEEALAQLKNELKETGSETQKASNAKLELEAQLQLVSEERAQSTNDLQGQLEALRQQYEEVLSAQRIESLQANEKADEYTESIVALEEKLKSAEQETKQLQRQAAEDLAALEKQREALQQEFEESKVVSGTRETQAEEEIVAIKQELEDSLAVLQQLEADKGSLHEERDRIQAELVDLQTNSEQEVERAVSERNVLEQAIEKLKDESTALEQELLILRQSSDDAGTEYQGLIDNLRADFGQAQQEIGELQQKTVETETEHQESLNKLQQKLEVSQAETLANSESLNEIRAELKKLDEQRISLSAKLEEEQRNSGFLKRSLATAEDAIEISDDELNKQGEESAAFKAQLSGLQAHVGELESEKAELEKHLNEIRGNQEEQEKQAQEAEQKQRDVLQQLDKELAAVRSELEKSNAEEIEREAGRKIELEALHAEKSEIEVQLAESQTRLQTKVQGFDTVTAEQQQRIDQMEQDLSAAKSEIERFAQAKEKAQDLQEPLQDAKQEISRLNKTIDGLREVQLEMETQLSDDSDEEILKLRAALEQEEKKRRNAEERIKQIDVLRREREVQETAVEILGEDVDNLEREKGKLKDDNEVLERKLSELRGQMGDSNKADNLLIQLDEMRISAENFEQERNKARSESARMQREVQELRGVIETYVEQIQHVHSAGENDESTALRSELDMVRRQASEDLEQMRGELTTAESKVKTLGGRDINEAASLQALRQETDSTRQALHEKDHMLRLSQTQCRTLEDAIEDRDGEVDQLRRKLELLIRKTSGLGEFSDLLGSERDASQTQPSENSQQMSDLLQELRLRRQSTTENDKKASKLGRLFRKK